VRAISCANCGAANVDFEGYCWTCEQRNVLAAPRPAWAEAVVVPAETPPAPKAHRVSLPRWFVTIVVPPVLTALTLGCLYTGYTTLRTVDTVLKAPPPVAPVAPVVAGASATADPATVAGCVIGTWKVVSMDDNMIIDGYGVVHLVGSGGTVTVGANGSMTFDYSGMSATGHIFNVTVGLVFSGRDTSKYRVVGKVMTLDAVTRDVTAVVTAGNVAKSSRVGNDSDSSSGDLDVSCAGTTLKLTYLARASETGLGVYLASRVGTS
jgi:hypothetical protein